MMKPVFMALALMVLTASTFAADLFQDGKLRQINSGSLILATDTIGGYPIFQDDGRWKFVSGKESTATGGTGTTRMGSVVLNYVDGTSVLALQSLLASVDVGGSNNSWSGSPCSPDHLVIRNKGQGRQDNCMTIDPKIVSVGPTPTLFLAIVLTNAGNSGRYYQMTLYVNADLLGVRNTGLGDWTKEVLKTRPYMQEALDRLTAWAEPLQDGSIRAFDYSKPQDVYAKIPSLKTLLPVPEELAGQKRAFGFLSAVEHLRHQPAFTSIAYSRYEDYKGAWSLVSGQTTQEIADATAFANCEIYRKANKPDAPVCEVYRPKDGKRISQTDGLEGVKKTGTTNKIAAGQNCLDEAQLRSANSNVSATVDFENQSGQAVKIFWMTYQGERKLFKELASAQSYRQQTYLAHPWVITDSAGKCLQIFTPRASSEKLVIN